MSDTRPAPIGRIQPVPANADTALTTAEQAAEQVVLEFSSPAAAQLAMPVPMRSRYTTYIVFCLFLCLFLAALLLPIDRVVPASANVVTVQPQTGLSAFETGIVRQILVRPGQSVTKGDVLLTLDPTNAAASVASFTEQHDSLTQETARLAAELDGKPYLSDGTKHGELQSLIFAQRRAEITSQMENYNQQITALRAQVAQAEADIKAYGDRLAFAASVDAKRRELERLGVGSQLNTLQSADQRREMQRSLEVATNQAAQYKGALASKISERDAVLEQWRATTSQSLKDQRDKLFQVTDQMIRAKQSLAQIELKAPFDATVFEIAASNAGTVVTTGSQLITLTPKDAPVEMEGVVDSMNAGFIRRGQRVVIKFDTFPYSTHGTAIGTVRVITPDATRQPFNPNTAPASVTQSQQAFGSLFFKVRVSIDKLELRNVPPDFKPVPGLQGSVEVLVGHRTFIEYLFSRLVPVATEGFREP